jgi:hypothetical protein
MGSSHFWLRPDWNGGNEGIDLKKISGQMANRSGQARIPAEVEILKVDAADSSAVRKVFQKAALVYSCTNVL